MRPTILWIALVIILVIFYLIDITHLTTKFYNIFLLILFGMVTVLILLLKICYQQNEQDE